MFGSEYANHPKMLLQSLQKMNSQYDNSTHFETKDLIKKLLYVYIKIFGIPEIGFQVRGMYFRKALRSLQNFHPKKILDAGSGIGSYAFYLAKLFPTASIEGWEIDKNKIIFCKKFAKELQVKNVQFIFRYINKPIRNKNTYDLIVNIDVLEHIKDYKKVLQNFYSMLRLGGYVYLHTPQLHQKRIFSKFKSWAHEDHVRDGFDHKKLVAELKAVGYKVMSVEHTFGFFGSLAWELHHFMLAKNFIIAGICYPILYLLALIDVSIRNNKGLAAVYIVKKA